MKPSASSLLRYSTPFGVPSNLANSIHHIKKQRVDNIMYASAPNHDSKIYTGPACEASIDPFHVHIFHLKDTSPLSINLSVAIQ